MTHFSSVHLLAKEESYKRHCLLYYKDCVCRCYSQGTHREAWKCTSLAWSLTICPGSNFTTTSVFRTLFPETSRITWRRSPLLGSGTPTYCCPPTPSQVGRFTFLHPPPRFPGQVIFLTCRPYRVKSVSSPVS